MLSWKIALLVFVVAGVVIGVLVWGLAFGGFKKKATTTTTTIASASKARVESSDVQSFAGNQRLSRRTVVAIDSLDAPTDTEMSNFGLMGEAVNYRVFKSGALSEEIEFDHTYLNTEGNTSYYRYMMDRRDDSQQVIIFQKESANDIMAELSNVRGAIMSIFVTGQNDMFANGFHPGSDDFNLITEQSFADMYTKMDSAKVLYGVQPGETLTGDEELYLFDALNPTDVTMVADLSDLPTLHANQTVPAADGGFRLALRYVDYLYTLSGSTFGIRLFLNDPVIAMATKAVLVGDTVKFVDLANVNSPQLKDDYSSVARPLTFWDQPHSIDEWEVEPDSVGAMFIQNMSVKVTGIPVAVTNASDVDLNQIQSNSLKLDLSVDPKFGFRDAKNAEAWGIEYTEEVLAANPAWQAILFEIPGINFRASIAFE